MNMSFFTLLSLRLRDFRSSRCGSPFVAFWLLSLLTHGSGLYSGAVCAEAPCAVDQVTQRGLRRTDLGETVVKNSIETVNGLVRERGLGLFLARPCESGEPSGIPVHVIASPERGHSSIASVPRECRCIFVDTALLAGWIQQNSAGTGRFELNAEASLSFILLHEIGHVVHGTRAVQFHDGVASQLNIDPTIAKDNEEAADEFASSILKRWSEFTPANSASISANAIVNELGKISWNMQAFRTLDEFGAFAAGKPAVFQDLGFSHPNLAWRILRSNYLIRPTPENRYLLDMFEEARERSAHPEPLFRLRNADDNQTGDPPLRH